jgi:TatD DNase family protein
MLVDSHCHLDFPDFEAELDDIVARAGTAGVGAMLTISTHVRRFERLRAIAERFPNVCCSVGTHPHYADKERDVTLEEILEKTEYRKTVAVGEAGLDYHYKNSPIVDQEASFRLHIAAARQTGLPLVIHTREADEHTGRILEEEIARGPFNAVLHCYTGGRALALRAVELGLYVSFTGILTYKGSDELRAIAAELPADRILVETDAPYLAPIPKRGKRNEPAYVVHTAATLAKVKGVSEAEIAEITTDNFFRLFSKAEGLIANAGSGRVEAGFPSAMPLE